jgi:succinylglutamate desuccinylase
MINPHYPQLEKFYYLQKELIQKGNQLGLQAVAPIEHALLIKSEHNDEVDLYISALIHGNEVIGLYIVNEILEQILSKTLKLKINLLISLGNVSAFLLNKRFMIRDMNRLFMISHKNKSDLSLPEEHRAYELETLIANLPIPPRAIFDIHQTTAPSESPFMMVREHASTLKWWQEIYSNWPLIYYPKGNMFSIEGASLSTYCVEKNIPEITIELGMTGIDGTIYAQAMQIINTMLMRPKQYWRDELAQDKNAEHGCHAILEKHADRVFVESEVIQKLSPSHELVSGWKNLTFLKKGSHYANHNDQKILTSADAYIMFPKYGDYQKNSLELCRFLRKLA